jgi:ribosomal subunit interface protein
MVVEFTGRQGEIAPDVRAVGERKLEKLRKVLHDITHVRVVTSVDRHLHRTEVSVHFSHFDVAAVEESPDAAASMSEAFEKVERQAQNHLGRLRERRDGAERQEPGA